MDTNVIKNSLIILGIVVSFVVTAGDVWMQDIRKDHPRLFMTKQEIPLLKKRASTVCKKDFDKLKSEVDALPATPKLVYRKERFEIKPDGGIKYLRGGEGFQLVKDVGAKNAVKAALVYLVTDDKQYLVKAKNYLKMALKFFNWCLEHKTMTAWYNTNRINALTAYDWIYNSLTPQERREIIVPLLKYIAALQPGKANFHRCTGGYNNGNYGVRSLMWFAGLTAYGDGFNDKLAEELLQRGYGIHKKMMDYRDKLSGGKGLLSAATTSYSFGAYPYASFLFLHTYKSATGKDISARWNHMRDYPNWFDWSSIVMGNTFYNYGLGDLAHATNILWVGYMYTHMAQAIHFYGKKYPAIAENAYALVNRLPAKNKGFKGWYPFLPFIVYGFDPNKKVASKSATDFAHAELFDSFGLAIMRSGTGKDDTYCLFRAGSKYGNHQHYDENHFTIFKKSFLALDSGSRTKTMHHCYYVPQSVAHNTILIHQDKEPMSPFWKPWGASAEKDDGKVYYNHGGQYSKTEAKCLTFTTNKLYTYVANDATKSYRASKCAEAVRQFLFIYPDYFVVYDRVQSQKKEQRKEWLLHVQNKLEKKDNKYFQTDNGGGRLLFRNFLPKKAVLREVGGPGKQFWASGKNWPLPRGEKAFARKNYYGQWRLEISSPEQEKAVRFLNLIQVGIAAQNPKMVPAELKQTSSQDGIVFTDDKGRKWEVLFNRTGKVGGNIKCWDKNGKEITSNAL